MFLRLRKLFNLESSNLIRDFSLIKLEEALKINHSEKAPGPDGFSMGVLGIETYILHHNKTTQETM